MFWSLVLLHAIYMRYSLPDQLRVCQSSCLNKATRFGGRQRLGGRETEELAMRECIQLHERHPHGSPIATGQWEGGKLVSAKP